MKKITHILCSALLTISLIVLNSSAVMASDIRNQGEGHEGMTLISESTYYDYESDVTITDRLYVSTATIFGASGSGRFRNDKTVTLDAGSYFDYWVSGYFTWNQDNDTATVSNVLSGHDLSHASWITIKDESTNSKSNTGGLFFGDKYAYAEYTFTWVNANGSKNSEKAYVDVNVKGESKTK